MTTELRVPAVGESVSEGVLARWLIAEGDVVAMDQPIFELETDKISTEVPLRLPVRSPLRRPKAIPSPSIRWWR